MSTEVAAVNLPEQSQQAVDQAAEAIAENSPALEYRLRVLERVQELVDMVHEIDNDYSKVVASISGFKAAEQELRERVSEVNATRAQIVHNVDTFRATFEAASILLTELKAILESPVVAKLLEHKIVVTRPATREELKTGDAIPVRQATAAELRN